MAQLGGAQNPSQLGLFKYMFPTGIEPAPSASEAGALSTELRELHPKYTTYVNISLVFSAS